MKIQAILACTAIATMVGCSPKLNVKVSNNQHFERFGETIAVDWSKVQQKTGATSAQDIVVRNSKGEETASQLVAGKNNHSQLIFQVNVAACSNAKYKISKGTQAPYATRVAGRLVPERLDDFAWENDSIAFRVYGPALQATGEISNGIDVWLKRTNEMVIDKWYKQNTQGKDYHVDRGQGLDCYKVGRTLGAAAMAPFIDSTIWLAKNFISATLIDSGAVRISFKLEYAPFMANGKELTESRTISLDAGSRFSTIEQLYSGNFDQLQVAAGIVLRPKMGVLSDTTIDGMGAICYFEPTNMDGGTNNGNTAVAAIVPQMQEALICNNHLLALAQAKNNTPLTYFVGAAWSKYGAPDAKEWQKIVTKQIEKINNPLAVKIK